MKAVVPSLESHYFI